MPPLRNSSLPRACSTAAAWLAVLWNAGCATTPLPLPPTITVDPDLVNVQGTDGPTVSFSGGPGAIDPGGTRIRVTHDPAEWGTPAEFVELDTEADGSFFTQVPGEEGHRFFIEALTEDEDIFIVALAGGAFGSTVTDPGPDSDDDGSPDAIDCAPEDPGVGGRRCD